MQPEGPPCIDNCIKDAPSAFLAVDIVEGAALRRSSGSLLVLLMEIVMGVWGMGRCRCPLNCGRCLFLYFL